jgi:hypothetical protein
MPKLKQDLKQLYEKDFILWVEENLRLIKEKTTRKWIGKICLKK